MACLHSFSFCFPFSASEIESGGKLDYRPSHLKASLRGTAAYRANQKSVEHTTLYPRGCVYYAAWDYPRDDSLTSTGRLPGRVSYSFSGHQSAQTIISGYWTGPDFEDGWGFVEAYVNQTT